MTKSHHPTFPPLPRPLFYILSFTWGLPMTLVGLAVALFLRLKGKRFIRAGYCLMFPTREDWGISLGLVILAPEEEVWSMYQETDRIPLLIYASGLISHEHGHAIQNVYLGFLFPFLVGLPSAIRFWWREWKSKHGNKPKTDYDAVWFEGSATKTGKKFFELFSEKYLTNL